MLTINTNTTNTFELPSERAAKAIQQIPFNSLCDIFERCFFSGGVATGRFPSDVFVIILEFGGENSAKQFGFTCKALNELVKRIQPLFDYKNAKAHEERFKPFYLIDPGNAVYFGKTEVVSKYTVIFLEDEAFLSRKGKYMRMKSDSPIPFEEGDRILPAAIPSKKEDAWLVFYRPDRANFMLPKENYEKAKAYIASHEWKILSEIAYSDEAYMTIDIRNDKRDLVTLTKDAIADGLFSTAEGPFDWYSASAKENAIPFYDWRPK